ncbi:MAG: serine/threonine protein kinase, partial [Planctomycetaceae bacterium]|nr:serine/threonine protein kinase [Planctomycetaceae bacterium]
TVSSFLQILSRSQLLNTHQLALVEQAVAESDSLRSADEIAAWLCEQELLTRWQADKLLQARHRGFFLGPYQLQERIARGGMSSIYAAIHRETGDIRALKVLPLTKSEEASYLPRFRREAAVTMRLEHPNIIRVYDLLTESDGRNDIHLMVMELLNGCDLQGLVTSEGPLPCRMAAEFIRQTAEGLQHAHDAGLIHRDIKPGNLFVDADSHTIRILDLGLAHDQQTDENLTRDFNERVLGTVDYLAPEQAVDSHQTDHRTDIYSLGCTLYFLLSGQPPFTDGTLVQRIVAHQTREPADLTEFRDDVPADLCRILNHMIKKDRAERFQSASEVSQALSVWLIATAGDDRLNHRPPELKPASINILRRDEVSSAAPGPQGISRQSAAEDSDTTVTSTAIDSSLGPAASEISTARHTTPSPYRPEFTEFLRVLQCDDMAHTVATEAALEHQISSVTAADNVRFSLRKQPRSQPSQRHIVAVKQVSRLAVLFSILMTIWVAAMLFELLNYFR